jgi:hypothetical protein
MKVAKNLFADIGVLVRTGGNAYSQRTIKMIDYDQVRHSQILYKKRELRGLFACYITMTKGHHPIPK